MSIYFGAAPAQIDLWLIQLWRILVLRRLRHFLLLSKCFLNSEWIAEGDDLGQIESIFLNLAAALGRLSPFLCASLLG